MNTVNTDKKENKHIKIKITGRVQAVFYRDGVKKIANQNNLVGTVESLKDGSIEIVASGDEKEVRNLLDWCYTGSPLSSVESLSFEYLKIGDKKLESKLKEDFLIKKNNKNYFVDKYLAIINFINRYIKKVKNITLKYFHFSKLENKIKETVLEHAPKHLVIIPDGNRRWAKAKGLLTWNGHKIGADNLKDLIIFSFQNKVKYITAWGFSTENWNRDTNEVEMLMKLFLDFIKQNYHFFLENKISFSHFGRKDRLSCELLNEIHKLESETKSFDEYHFAIALDYGGRDEIQRAINESKRVGDESNFEKYIDTAKFPDPDLIIRTGGERRSSGMMPWQSAYAEYYFSNLNFPDFKTNNLRDAFLDYSSRNRRFGK